jgi:hypothetical protein
MPNLDSIDRLVDIHFAAIASEPFTYKQKQYQPKPLFVSPLLFRGFTCPAHCGACCIRVSLDYLPEHKDYNEFTAERVIEFNEKAVSIWSDMQANRDARMCRNLLDNGRCNIHGKHPFACDFEFVRFTHYKDKSVLQQRLFGRGWALTRVDGKTKGSMCEITKPDSHTISEVVRKLTTLKAWADHFQLASHIPSILQWIEAGECDQGLWLGQTSEQGFFSLE